MRAQALWLGQRAAAVPWLERERKRERKGGPIRKTGLGANNHGAKLGAKIYGAKLGAKIYGAELGAKIYGAELPAKSPPRLRRAQDLDASNDDAEKCKLGASNDTSS